MRGMCVWNLLTATKYSENFLIKHLNHCTAIAASWFYHFDCYLALNMFDIRKTSLQVGCFDKLVSLSLYIFHYSSHMLNPY